MKTRRIGAPASKVDCRKVVRNSGLHRVGREDLHVHAGTADHVVGRLGELLDPVPDQRRLIPVADVRRRQWVGFVVDLSDLEASAL